MLTYDEFIVVFVSHKYFNFSQFCFRINIDKYYPYNKSSVGCSVFMGVLRLENSRICYTTALVHHSGMINWPT